MTKVMRTANIIAMSLATVIVAVTMMASNAQAQPSAIDSLLNGAIASIARGDTTRALDMLEIANKRAPKNADVLYWRGTLLARSTFLRVGDIPRNVLAWRLLEKAAQLDPRNPRYLLEMGRIRLYTPLLRIEAERLFRKALRVAEESGQPEQIADVAWELGQIKERRYATARDRYMITSPGLMYEASDAISQRHYTREFLSAHARPIENVGSVDRSEAEELYRRGLAALPTHEASAVGLLGLLYDQRRYQEMREVVRPFLDAGTGSARLRFAAGLAAYRTGHLKDAELLFDEALTRLTSAERADATDLSRIIRRRDAIAYEALGAEDRARTDSSYWEAADPLLSTAVNEGKLEFLARVAIADLRFSDADMKQTGWRTDRGLILIRYGEPPVVATFAPSSSADAADAIGRVITVWFYPRPEREFVFTGPPAMNYSTFAGDMRGVTEEVREDAPFLLDNLPFAAGIDTVPVQVARFRGKTDSTTQVVVAASVNTNNLYSAVELDRSKLALSLRVGAPSQLRLLNADTLAVQLPAVRATPRTWIHQLVPGHYRVRVEAQDLAVAGAAGRSQTDVDIVRPVAGALELSDLLVADRAGDPASTVSGFVESGLTARGSLTLSQRETFSVYWENYGLRPDSAGRVKLDVKLKVTLLEIDRSGQQAVSRFLGNIADVVGLTKEGDQQLGVQFQRDELLGNRDRVPQVTTIGLGTAPAGTYKLEVTVTDRVSGNSSSSDRIFYLSPQRP